MQVQKLLEKREAQRFVPLFFSHKSTSCLRTEEHGHEGLVWWEKKNAAHD